MKRVTCTLCLLAPLAALSGKDPQTSDWFAVVRAGLAPEPLARQPIREPRRRGPGAQTLHDSPAVAGAVRRILNSDAPAPAAANLRDLGDPLGHGLTGERGDLPRDTLHRDPIASIRGWLGFENRGRRENFHNGLAERGILGQEQDSGGILGELKLLL